MGFPRFVRGQRQLLVSQGRGRVQTRLVLPGLGLVAGVQVLEGRLSQTSYVRLTRDQRVLWSGRALAGPAAGNVVMASFVAAIALLGVGVSVVAAGSITAGRMVAGALATGRWGRVAAAGGLLGLVTLSGVAEIAVVATVFPNPTRVR